jgi:autotransporter passenger strand-loop-strand repeat protein
MLSGGTELVYGSDTSATVASGGLQDVIAGGTATSATVSGGGTQVVYGGADAAATTVASDGVEVVYGSAAATTVNSGGTQYDVGTASGTTLSGGTQDVLAGGTASGTTVFNGGLEIVSSGGFANATALSGGTLEVASGGSAGAILFSDSGTLQLDALMAFGGTISGFHTPADAIDLRGLAFSSGTTNLSWTQLTSGANGSGTLTVTSGAEIQTLNLLGQYSTANFSATSDGNGGTLITDPPVLNSVVQTAIVAAQHA